MIETVVAFMASWIINVIETTNYWGIGFLMAVESANIPIPSEITMTFAGYLVFEERLSFFWVVVAGGVGNLIGSLVSYAIGYVGGRPLLEKYGRYFFVHKKDLALADSLFSKYGSLTVFLCRELPIVRTFISLPAGIARMNIWKFSVYTLIGSLIWSYLLTYIGVKAGENWESIGAVFHRFDEIIIALLLILFVWWIWRHIKNH